MKNKYISIIIGLIILSILGYLVFNQIKKLNVISILDSQIEISRVKDNIDTSFVVIPNDDLILKIEVTLSEDTKNFVEQRIEEYKKKILEFNENTSIIDKINSYFIVSADYRILGDYKQAKELLEKALTLDPQNSNLFQVYSSLLSVMGDKTSALLYINKAIALYPIESNYWLWKFDLEKERGLENEKLELIYKDGLKMTNENLNIVTAYATFLGMLDRNEEAIIYWQKAIKLYPENTAIYQAEIDRLSKL